MNHSMLRTQLKNCLSSFAGNEADLKNRDAQDLLTVANAVDAGGRADE